MANADRATLSVPSVTTSSPEVRFEPAGEVPGEQVLRYFLVNSAGTEVAVLTFGGIIESFHFPDRLGERRNIVLGFGLSTSARRGKWGSQARSVLWPPTPWKTTTA